MQHCRQLAWCTLLCQGLHPHLWAHGFELLRGLCQWNPIPLNLRVFQPFLWLLFGAFTETRFDDTARHPGIYRLHFGTLGTGFSFLSMVHQISVCHESVTPDIGQ